MRPWCKLRSWEVEKVLGKYWESTKKVLGKYWESTGKVLRKYWESMENEFKITVLSLVQPVTIQC